MHRVTPKNSSDAPNGKSVFFSRLTGTTVAISRGEIHLESSAESRARHSVARAPSLSPRANLHPCPRCNVGRVDPSL